jgi:hypothetical protein
VTTTYPRGLRGRPAALCKTTMDRCLSVNFLFTNSCKSAAIHGTTILTNLPLNHVSKFLVDLYFSCWVLFLQIFKTNFLKMYHRFKQYVEQSIFLFQVQKSSFSVQISIIKYPNENCLHAPVWHICRELSTRPYLSNKLLPVNQTRSCSLPMSD